MKKLVLLLAVHFLISGFIMAQDKFILKSNARGIFIEHTVAPKESYYSVGRMYNVGPKDIAAFNGLDMNKGLVIGQQIHIPLNTHNFSQATDKGVPVYYHVGEGEGLYRVSLNSNKVQMEKIRKWNHLQNDNITAGSSLVVGFLTGVDPSLTAHTTPAATAVVKATEKPAVIVEDKNVKAVEEKKEAAAATVVKTEAPKKEEPKQTEVTKPVVEKQEPVKQPAVSASAGSGYFKSYFDQQVKTFPPKKEETVTAGVFKTASGWQDGKYYMLIDKVEPGMIVKITNPSNGKTVYAKVLGEMSGIRQNNGLDIRMSNSAAAVLNIQDDDKFIVQIRY